jgi:hypothetical protein
VNPKLGVRPAIAGRLMTFRVEDQQVVFAYKRRAQARRENESVCSWNARAQMAERRCDTLLVENVTRRDNVLF